MTRHKEKKKKKKRKKMKKKKKMRIEKTAEWRNKIRRRTSAGSRQLQPKTTAHLSAFLTV